MNATAANATVNNTVCEDCWIDYYSPDHSDEECIKCPELAHTRGLTKQAICGKCLNLGTCIRNIIGPTDIYQEVMKAISCARLFDTL